MATAWVWLISNPWRGLVIALALYIAFLKLWTIPHLERNIADLKLSKAALESAVAIQNEAVRNWERTAKQAQENQRAAMAVADRAMGEAKGKATVILKEPKPTPDKECQAALELLRKYQ